MFGDELHQEVEGVNQVDADVQAVVVPVEVLPPDEGIDLVGGHELLDDFVFAEQERGGEGEAFGAGDGVRPPEAGFHQQVFIREPQPGVFRREHPDFTARFGERRRLEIGEFQVRVDDLLGVVAVFPIHNRGDTDRLGYAEIAIVTAIIDDPSAAVDLGTGWHLEDQYEVAFVVHAVGREEMRRVEFLGVVGEIDDVSGETIHGGRVNAGHPAPVIHAE